MTDIALLYQSAQLTNAAYATLIRDRTDSDLNKVGLISASGSAMSTSQVAEFTKQFQEVMAQFDDTSSGNSFSATLFKDTAGDDPGNLTLAIRGTAEFRGIPNDLSTDADIWLAGAGFDQIIAMANWWRKVATPVGTSVVQHAVAEGDCRAVCGDSQSTEGKSHHAVYRASSAAGVEGGRAGWLQREDAGDSTSTQRGE